MYFAPPINQAGAALLKTNAIYEQSRYSGNASLRSSPASRNAFPQDRS